MLNIKRIAIGLAIVMSGAAESAASERYGGPIIDMHLHAYEEVPPFGLCVPWLLQFPVRDTRENWSEVFEKVMFDPPCDDPIPSISAENGELMRETIKVMERRNVVGVLSGAPEKTREWRAAAPERFMPSIEFQLTRDDYTSGDLRKLFESGDFVMLGEISNQYAGISPDDERMLPYWELMQELDRPVAIHMEQGVPGVSYLPYGKMKEYRARFGNPYLLEEMLNSYPNLRVSVMHYAAPLTEEMIAIMNLYPHVYIDIGGMQWFYPREYFYQQLKQFVDAGLGKRIMFGSDQGEWPGVIDVAIDIIDEAPFLTNEQKADIFYNNAARFLRLTDEQIAEHRALAN